MFGRIQRIFYISIDGLEVFVGNRHGYACQQQFLHNDNGVQKFADYLVASVAAHSAIIVDIIEEEFKQEQIPKVSRLERQGLLQRKMMQHFRGTDLCLAAVTGKVKGARIEEKVVMSALTNSALLDPWLDQMQQLKVPVAAIYSAPFLAARLVRQNVPHQQYAVLVTYHEGVGLRQTLVHDGHVLFSRLCPGPLATADEYRQALTRELDKTERYINKLKLVPAEQELHVYVVMCEKFQATTAPDLVSGAGDRHLHYITPAVVQMTGRRKMSGEQAQIKNLMCWLAAQGVAAVNYSGASHMFYYRQYRIQAGIRMAGAVSLLLFVSLTIASLIQGYVSKLAIARMTQQAHAWEQEYQDIVKHTASTDVPPKFVRDSVTQAGYLAEHRLRLNLLLGGISTELRAYRNIEIEAIEWVKGSQIAQARDANSGNEYFLDIYPMPALELNDQVVLLRGRVVTDTKGYTDIFRMLTSLKTRLEKVKTIKDVQLVRLPIDKESSGQIDGRYNAWHPELQAEFVLRAVYHDS